MNRSVVRVWEDYITLPSYLLDGYDPHPLFDELYNKECYPYPLAALKGDRHKKRAKYLAVHIENEFLELICFPHFGGRIYSCRDKITGQDIFHPVERVGVAFMPAEAGGTYCGCGVEISFPTHHSLTNVRKREYRVLMNPDGSATIVMGELELRMRMRWEVRLTLRPGVARLEQEMRIHNRTHLYGRGRYWGNASMHQTPGMVASYPESFAYEHGAELGIATWPIYDHVDMRQPFNIPGPIGLEMKDVRNGYYAYYDRDRKFGMVHWAPADEAPAKKYWTWGSSQHLRHRAEWFADGKDYLEMQSGRVEDQEEFEIYPPFCLKRWREVWYPIREIGPVDAAGPDAALSCEPRPDGARVSVYAAKDNPSGKVVILDERGRELGRRRVVLRAGRVSHLEFRFRARGEFRVVVLSGDRPLTTFFRREEKFYDNAADRIARLPAPKEPETADDAMMVYERDLDYFRHKWTDFEKDLERVLEKDPNHQAAHRWMGIWLVRRGLYADAERHLDKAIERCVHDGEAHFYKGICRLALGDVEEARWRFKMACRHNEIDRGAFMLGVLAMREGDMAEALERLDACLDANGNNLRARLYRAIVLARLGRKADARADVADVVRRMPSEALAPVVEAVVRRGTLRGFLGTQGGKELARQLRQDVQTYLELVCDLMAPGLYDHALELAEEAKRECRGEPGGALMDLYRGYLLDRLGRAAEAKKAFAEALRGERRFAFTFRDEEEPILDCAERYFPRNGVVHHYRALIRGKQARYDEAYDEWRKAVRLGVKDPIILRGMATIAWKHKGDAAAAERLLDRALALDPEDINIRGDLLALTRARKDRKKFERLISHPGLASTRLIAEIVNYRVAQGDYDGAVRAIVEEARFPNSCQDYHHLYELALTARAFDLLKKGDFRGAERDLRQALKSPRHLGIQIRKKRFLPRVLYFLGLALRGQGREDEARRVWESALNDQEFDYWLGSPGWGYGIWLDRYWQGRILLELGREKQAQAYFEGMLAYAMSKTRTMGEAQRRELYRLAREGTSAAPIASILTDVSYLELE